MKLLVAIAILGFCAQQAFAEEIFDDDSALEGQEARFLYFNTSSTATSLTLLGALILLGVIGYLVYAGGLLGASSSGYSRNGFGAENNYQQEQNQYYEQSYAQYR